MKEDISTKRCRWKRYESRLRKAMSSRNLQQHIFCGEIYFTCVLVFPTRSSLTWNSNTKKKSSILWRINEKLTCYVKLHKYLRRNWQGEVKITIEILICYQLQWPSSGSTVSTYWIVCKNPLKELILGVFESLIIILR